MARKPNTTTASENKVAEKATTKTSTRSKGIMDAFNAPKKFARKTKELADAEPIVVATAEKKTTPVKTDTAVAVKQPLRKNRGKSEPNQAVAQPEKTAQHSVQPPKPQRVAQAAAPAAPPVPVLPPHIPNWVRVDLHMHTMASHDYEQPEKSYLDILQQAERRSLNLIAFTDHNTVNGYRNMYREIADLELLERLARIRPDELNKLEEYRRLLKKIVVLPGFEFTATFGFHILGIFPPDKPLREIESVLTQLRVPNSVINDGLTEAPGTLDVLMAYEMINEAGGIAIAAHANSSNGVSMRNMNLGGQTRIAFTQDPNLHAIEFTDLDKGKRSSAMLFQETRAEYARHMHVLQGSDAHRIASDPRNSKRLGVGERPTEMDLPEASFKAILDLFKSDHFERVRPVNMIEIKPNELQAMRTAGESATVVFHPALGKKNKFEAILNDVVALANYASQNFVAGLILVGCEPGIKKKTAGIAKADEVASELSAAIYEQIQPNANVSLKIETADDKQVIVLRVNASDRAPFAIGNKILVRDGTGTREATRDELIALVRKVVELQLRAQGQLVVQPQQTPSPQQAAVRGDDVRDNRDRREVRGNDRRDVRGTDRRDPRGVQPANRNEPPRDRRDARPNGSGSTDRVQQFNNRAERTEVVQREQRPPQAHPAEDKAAPQAQAEMRKSSFVEQLQQAQAAFTGGKPEGAETNGAVKLEGAPRNGVQVVSMDFRDGQPFFAVKDTRNNSTVRNVTMKSARDLWHYAITQHADHPDGPTDVTWEGDKGDKAVVHLSVRAGKMRYDLAQRDANGKVHVFYGVTEDGLTEEWRRLVDQYEPDPEDIEPSPTLNT